MTHSTTGLMRNLRTAAIFIAVLFGLNACDSGDSAPSVAAITAQPTDQSVVASTAATFTVVATDATSYQWQSSADSGSTFVDVSGATSASYTTTVTTLGDSGTQYRVVVSGASNSVTSSAVTLTVTTVPVASAITAHPSAQTITEGQNASFSVTATGTSLDYQWQQSTDNGANFANVAGATNATLALTLVPQADNTHQFRVVVSNSVNSVTSNAALLTVTAAQTAPAFSTQPANQSVIAPNTATFNVAVTGSPGPTLQWQVSTNVGSSFADIAGATASSYTTAATVAGDNSNQYRVVATNGSGSTASNIATLTVNLPAAPGFTTQPADVTITEGQNAQFTVVVTGTPTPTLQWQVSTDSGSNWSNITNETGSTYTAVAPAQANNGRQFRCVASNSEGSVNSNAATLMVTAASPVTITTSSPLPVATMNVAYSVTLTTSGGTPPFTWSVANGSTLPSFLTLNASTGEISGTPDAGGVLYGWEMRVTDSANPQQSNQQYFELFVETPCDNGFGWATVGGAPTTVQGKFCPERLNGPTGPYSDGTIIYVWVETYPYGSGSYYEIVGVRFDQVSDLVTEVSFTLHDITRSWTYYCVATATVDRPACSGVTVNTGTRTVYFVDTVVGAGTSPVFTLNGTLTY